MGRHIKFSTAFLYKTKEAQRAKRAVPYNCVRARRRRARPQSAPKVPIELCKAQNAQNRYNHNAKNIRNRQSL